VRRLLNWVVLLLLPWLTVPVHATADLALTHVQAYAYVGHQYSASMADAITERGPPDASELIVASGAFDLVSHGASARLHPAPTVAGTTYDDDARSAQFDGGMATTQEGAGVQKGRVRVPAGVSVAAEGGERLPWTSWQNYPKVTQAGREYARIGDRLYTRHAVDRLQPSGLGAPAGATGAGRSISPNFVEDVLTSTRGVPVKGPAGEARMSFTSGTAQVITENDIVITVITR
jgi:hypothetical protein